MRIPGNQGESVKTYLVESTSNINRGLLDDVVDDFRKWGKEIGGVDFRVEEDLGGEEAFVSNIDRVRLV